MLLKLVNISSSDGPLQSKYCLRFVILKYFRIICKTLEILFTGGFCLFVAVCCCLLLFLFVVYAAMFLKYIFVLFTRNL